ncbi:hypothetical protein FM076_21750 [Streptomyces albus subsp. chlorinus]|uniref:hypothetical protein n=1 Tax=Streptomyces albus TaxID=1888 RepID=UPI001570D9F9|nr:hypothetical protein [Streptomyces albus]NSC23634.1 hypothetical protein [Streptomyces albus subsp. chlorinus]
MRKLGRGRDGRHGDDSREAPGTGSPPSPGSPDPAAALAGTAHGGDAGAEGEGALGERARRGRLRLLVAAALFATLILPKVVSAPGRADEVSARPSPGAGSVPAYPTPQPGDGDGATAGPSPSGSAPATGAPPDPSSSHPVRPGATGPAAGPGSASDSLAGAFRSVRAGQCLTIHGSGSGWSRPAPVEATRVPCGDERAYTRVTAVHHTGPGTGTDAGPGRGPGGDVEAACPTGNGRASWTHGETTLCLTRQFRTDQCLLAESAGGEVRAALMSAPACSTRPPSGQGRYDRLLRITGVYRDTTSCREGDAGTHAHYWTWKVDGGSRTLCTADAAE